jgi:hypothetical protein
VKIREFDGVNTIRVHRSQPGMGEKCAVLIPASFPPLARPARADPFDTGTGRFNSEISSRVAAVFDL